MPATEIVTRKFFGNIGLDRLCRTDVSLAACVFIRRKARPRPSKMSGLRGANDGLVEVANGAVILAVGEKSEAAMIKHVA